MKKVRLRNAFSMLTAIFVIVIMATVSVLVMSLSGKIVKTTTAQFQHEQAILYVNSYTEYAILAVTGHSRVANCIDTISGNIGTPSTGQGYRISTHISYIGPATEVGNCAVVLNTINVLTPTTPLTVIIDVYADYKDPDNTSGAYLTVHRRTVQKI